MHDVLKVGSCFQPLICQESWEHGHLLAMFSESTTSAKTKDCTGKTAHSSF